MKNLAVLLGIMTASLLNGAGHPAILVIPPPPPPPPIPLPAPEECELAPLRATSANLQLLGQAVEAYRTNNNSCPVAASVSSLLTLLVPAYLPQLASPEDGWGRPLRYEVWMSGSPTMQHCGLASAGRDGLWEFSSLAGYPAGLAYYLDNDLVMTDGRFTWLYDDPRRSGQDRYYATAQGMKIMAGAIEQYNTAYNSYPAGTIEQIYALLTPAYLGILDYRGTTDHWGRPYIYLAWATTGTGPPNHYLLASSGRDGVWEKTNPRDYTPRIAISYDNDIVMTDGQFIEIVDDASLTLAQIERLSMGKMKTLASTLAQYNTDYNSYPVATTIDGVLALLQPNYLSSGLGFDVDGFRQKFRYVEWGGAVGFPVHYRLASIGRNGTVDLPDLCSPLPAIRPSGFDDIIIQDGRFISAPDSYSPPVAGNGCAAPLPPPLQLLRPAALTAPPLRGGVLPKHTRRPQPNPAIKAAPFH